MPYVATALARGAGGSWSGADVEAPELKDLDTAADLLRDLLGEGGGPALLLVEEDDEWCGIVRVDGEVDVRVFLSDARVLEVSELAGRLFAELPPVVSDDDDEQAAAAEAEPAGDAEIVADLGTPAGRLLALCAEEGLLPADVLAAVAEGAGCLEELEALREP